MSEELKWIIGLGVSSALSFTGMLITAFYTLAARVRAGDDVLSTKIDNLGASLKDGDDALHQRINRTRDEYVKRADLDGHITRIYHLMEKQQEQLERRDKDISEKLDRIADKIRTI